MWEGEGWESRVRGRRNKGEGNGEGEGGKEEDRNCVRDDAFSP